MRLGHSVVAECTDGSIRHLQNQRPQPKCPDVGGYDVLNLERSLFLFLNKQITQTALLIKNVGERCAAELGVMRAKGSWAATFASSRQTWLKSATTPTSCPIYHDLQTPMRTVKGGKIPIPARISGDLGNPQKLFQGCRGCPLQVAERLGGLPSAICSQAIPPAFVTHQGKILGRNVRRTANSQYVI